MVANIIPTMITANVSPQALTFRRVNPFGNILGDYWVVMEDNTLVHVVCVKTPETDTKRAEGSGGGVNQKIQELKVKKIYVNRSKTCIQSAHIER